MEINTKKETKKIIRFIQSILKKQMFQNTIIGISGGIDSATSLHLLARAIPVKYIFAAHLYVTEDTIADAKLLCEKIKIPKENFYLISIKEQVEFLAELLKIDKKIENKFRIGNIAARLRMIILYDLAKKHQALVCGTENKSEHLLGYFTRFGDQASDFEPIEHLYKTQVYELAQYLKVPEKIHKKNPTAGLWEGQTDEKEFGFSYKEADKVLHLYFDKHVTIQEIKKKGFSHAKEILQFARKNSFKHKTPYTL